MTRARGLQARLVQLRGYRAGSVGLFLLLALASLMLARHYLAHGVQQHAADFLQQGAQLKAETLSAWLAERQADAAVTVQDPFLLAHLQAPPDAVRLSQRLRLLQHHYHYRDVWLLDADGRFQLSASGQRPGPDQLRSLRLSQEGVHMGDMRLMSSDARDVGFTLSMPIMTGAQAIAAYLVLVVDARQFLYARLLDTTEAYQSEGFWLADVLQGQVRLLSARGDEPLLTTLAQSRSWVDRVMFDGQVVEGVSGVDQDVWLVAAAPVAHTSWYVLAKLSQSELTARVNGLLRWLLLAVVALVVLLWVGMALWWRSKETTLLRDYYQLQVEHQHQRALADKVFEVSPDGIIITDVQGTILAVNPAFERLSGYAADEVTGRNPRFLRSGKQDAAFYAQMWEAISQQGSWEGEVYNRRKNGEFYVVWLSITAVTDAYAVPTHYVGISRDITDLKEASARTHYLANYDVLTGLANRSLLHERLLQALSMARRTGSGLALLFLDLDGFKPVNDQLGHAAGDELLQQIGARLQSCMREADTVARLGGDEFVMVLPMADAEQVAGIAQRVLTLIEQPVYLGGQEVRVSASIGSALFPQDALEAEGLMQCADQAMYAVKKQGKRSWMAYHADLS